MKANLKKNSGINFCNLTELTTDEKLMIIGGDRFMYDLGRLCGNIYNWLRTPSPIGAPTMTGMS